MAVLGYSNVAKTPRFEWGRLLVALVFGAASGAGFSQFVYDLLLRFLSHGVQIYYTDRYEPFDLWVRFATAFALGGAVVCGCAAVFGGPWRRFLIWLIAFAGLYFIGATAGLLYARSQWKPLGPGNGAVESVRLLHAPVTGTVVVLIAVLVVAVSRLAARPSA